MSEKADLVLKGTRYYAAGEEYRKRRLKVGSEVFLIHTPYNPFDSNAVAVYLMPSGKPLGHISRQVAPKYSVLVDANRINSAKVISIEKTSSAFLRIEIRLRIGIGEKSSKNEVTGTTQILPSTLISQLQKDRYDKEKAHYESINESIRGYQEKVATAKTTFKEAGAKLASSELDTDEQARIRQLIKDSASKENKKLWGGSATGAMVGAMAGGPVGAMVGGMVGFFGGALLGKGKSVINAEEKLRQFELSCREYDAAKKHLRNAEGQLRKIRSTLPVKPKPIVGQAVVSGTARASSARNQTQKSHPEVIFASSFGYPNAVNCQPCGGRVELISYNRDSWQRCPKCGFLRRTIR